MNRNPNKRLGSGLLDSEELKSHVFFSDIDFNKFLYKKFTPPDLKNCEGIDNMKKEKEKAYHLSFMKKEMNNNLKEDIANSRKSSDREIKGWTFIGRNNHSKSMKNFRK